MVKKLNSQHIKELKDMLQAKEPHEPVEKILITFCERHALSLEACRRHYEELIAKGEIKEK
ncbi:MAG: hypothetical protein QXU99_01775 [Candidatus Bathyarchaeia archaeon]